MKEEEEAANARERWEKAGVHGRQEPLERKGPHKCHSFLGDINGKCQRGRTYRRLGLLNTHKHMYEHRVSPFRQ